MASIAPAFPEIIRALGVHQEDTAWLISAFTIPGLLFTPVTGHLSDRFGRRKILIPCLLLFGVAGGACFLARDFRTLLILRFMQGVGSAPLNALNVVLIGDFFEGHDRSAAMGYNTSVIGVGTASYPAIGGLLAMAGWNYPFLLSLLAIPIGIWAYMRLDEGKRETPSATRGKVKKFRPLLPELLKRGTPVLLFASMMTFIIQYGGFLTFLPFYLKFGYGATPLTIGLVSAGMSLSSAVTSSGASWFLNRFSGRFLLSSAFIFYASAFLFILHVPGSSGMIIPAVLFGIGQGINIPNLLTMLTDNSPEQSRAMFLSLNSMSLRLGQTVGPPIFGAIFAFQGIRAVFTTGAVMAAAMAVIIFGTLREISEKSDMRRGS